jgi:hypothetical protein
VLKKRRECTKSVYQRRFGWTVSGRENVTFTFYSKNIQKTIDVGNQPRRDSRKPLGQHGVPPMTAFK